jgi:hypothetical protein
LPSWFAKLLEGNFSRFAKIRWMTSWFAKLLKLLLHQEPWGRNKIVFMPFHLFKTYIRNLEMKTKLFLCPSTSCDMKDAHGSTCAYIRMLRLFLPTWHKWKPRMRNCWRNVFLFLLKNKNDNMRWEIVGDA